MSNGRKVLSPPGRSSWVWWKPSQAQQMPAPKLEKEMSLAFKSHYWGSSFWSEEGRKQSFPCWPPVWRTFQEQLVFSCFLSFLTRQFVTTTPRSWQQGQGSGCLWTLSQMALQGLCYISQSKQPATEKRKGSELWGSEDQFEVGEREEKQLIQVPWQQKDLMFWEGPQVIRETETGQGRCEESWAGDYRERVQSCSWKLWFRQMGTKEVSCASS